MKRIIPITLIPSFVISSLAGISLFTTSPAKADEHLVRDAAIGAGVTTLSGVVVRHRKNVLKNAARGAAAGAAVNLVNGTRSHYRRSYLQDAGVGAAASTGAGYALHGNTHHSAGDAADGAAVGTAINLLSGGHR
jgi:hypothetical protein